MALDTDSAYAEHCISSNKWLVSYETNIQIHEKTQVVMDSMRLDIIIVTIIVTWKEKFRVLKFHMKSSSYFEISTSIL